MQVWGDKRIRGRGCRQKGAGESQRGGEEGKGRMPRWGVSRGEGQGVREGSGAGGGWGGKKSRVLGGGLEKREVDCNITVTYDLPGVI